MEVSDLTVETLDTSSKTGPRCEDMLGSVARKCFLSVYNCSRQCGGPN